MNDYERSNPFTEVNRNAKRIEVRRKNAQDQLLIQPDVEQEEEFIIDKN